MILLAAFLIISLTGLALYTAASNLPEIKRSGWGGGGLLLVLVLLSMVLVFRPDEEIEIGEDAASYFHVAQSLLRTNTLGGTDRALSEIPPEERALFRYGHAGFWWTKNMVFWAEDENFERVAPHFFPAYSFLLAGAMALAGSYAAFWFSSLIALGCGVLISCLSVELTRRRWIGFVSYLIFLLHPITVWNARALRAEWPASFFLLLGILLFLHAHKPRNAPFFRGILSGFCLSGAILFHATALYVFLPALLAAGVQTRKTPFWGGWWLGAIGGSGLLVLQTLFVTDPYRILFTLQYSPDRRNLFLLALGLLLGAIVFLRLVFQKRCQSPFADRILGGVMALTYLALVFLVLSTRDDLGHLPFLPEWSVAFISLTDFEGVMRMTSRIGFLLALAGFFMLCQKSESGRWVFFLLAPATMTIGWVINYMFETRRMVTFLLPLYILSVCSLIDFIIGQLENRLPAFKQERRAVLAGLVMAILFIGLGVRGRMELYSTWNFRGIHGFYRQITEKILPEADFLFAEYTQTAVPIEQKTGLPLLPVDWDRRSDAEIEQAEAVWKRLILESPERRHVLISPFRGSAIPGVAMDPLLSFSVRTRTLARARRQVPRQVNHWTRTLHVHRLLPPGVTAARVPYLREFRGSRLGIKGLANPMERSAVELSGVRADTGFSFVTRPGQPLVLFFLYPHGHRQTPPVIEGGTAEVIHLDNLWQKVTLRPDEESVRVHSHDYSFLVQKFVDDLTGPVSVPLPIESELFGVPSMESQWLRARASIIIPEHAGHSRIWFYARNGRVDDETVRVRLTGDDRKILGEVALSSEWAWYIVELEFPGDAHGDFGWIHLETTPAFDPESPRYPNDLGFQISLFMVQPLDVTD
jgi:hypothetical protein